MKIEQTEYSETSAIIIQVPGNYPEKSIQNKDSNPARAVERSGTKLPCLGKSMGWKKINLKLLFFFYGEPKRMSCNFTLCRVQLTPRLKQLFYSCQRA